MRGIKSIFALSALAVAGAVPAARAQISIQIGPEPSCPYGYYGPEWFVGGRFVGAGKWFHGPANFHGNVNNHFDPQHGYKGPVPKPGPAQAPRAKFKPNESRDGQGHAGAPHK